LVAAVPLVWLATTITLLEPRFIAELFEHGWAAAALHLKLTVIVIAVGVVAWNLSDPLRKVGRDTAARAKRIVSIN
jgi:hypothetical protein